MPYESQNWKDNDPRYPGSAARFSHIEEGIKSEEERALTVEDTKASKTELSSEKIRAESVESRKADLEGEHLQESQLPSSVVNSGGAPALGVPMADGKGAYTWQETFVRATSVLVPSGDATGITDTAAFKKALEVGGLIICAPGTYYYTSISQMVPQPTTIWAYGATWLSTLGKEANTIALNLWGDSVTLLGGTYDYTVPVNNDVDGAKRSATGHTIRLGVAHPKAGEFYDGALIRDVTINNSRNSPISINGYSKVRVLDNVLGSKQNQTTGGLGNGIILVDCPYDMLIRGNQIAYQGDDAIAVLCDAGLPALSQKVIVVENMITNTYANGVGFSGVDGGLIDHNVIDTTWADGIHVWEDSSQELLGCNNVTIGDNNVIKNAGKYFGPGQYKTAAGTNGYGVQIGGPVTGIVMGYPRITGSQLGAYNVGLTGNGKIRRGQPLPQRAAVNNGLGTLGVAVSSGIIAANRAYCVPVYVTDAVVAKSLNIHGTNKPGSEGSVVRLGIYNDTGNLLPGKLLIDLGTVATTAEGLKTINIEPNLELSPGLYWLVAVGQGGPVTQPTVSTLAGNAYPLGLTKDPSVSANAYYKNGVEGALPAEWGSSDGVINGGIAINIGL